MSLILYKRPGLVGAVSDGRASRFGLEPLRGITPSCFHSIIWFSPCQETAIEKRALAGPLFDAGASILHSIVKKYPLTVFSFWYNFTQRVKVIPMSYQI